jgi:hypothetical protein
MGLFDAFRSARVKNIQDSTSARGLQKGTHQENCERCNYSVSNKKSPTGLSCTHYKEHVPANGVCGLYTR